MSEEQMTCSEWLEECRKRQEDNLAREALPGLEVVPLPPASLCPNSIAADHLDRIIDEMNDDRYE